MTGHSTHSKRTFIVSFITSAFLSAAAALMLAASVSSPTSNNIAVTHIEPADPSVSSNEIYVNLGILGGCTNLLSLSYSGDPGADCYHTKVGYVVSLLLPYDANGNDSNTVDYPYDPTRPYFIVTSGDSKNMVVVPIATAFQLLGLLAYLLSTCTRGLFLGWVAAGSTALAMILAWTSFGVTYHFTDIITENLKMYNDDVLATIDPLVASRGNAVWFLVTAAALLTVALPGVLWMQYEKRRGLSARSLPETTRKQSTSERDVEMS